MKKIIYILTALFAISISAFAATVKVSFSNGSELEGGYISHNDTLLLMEPNYEQTNLLEIKPGRVQYFTILGVGRFVVENDKFIPDVKTKAKLEKQRVNQEIHAMILRERAAKPNEIIGKAFKTTGSVCIGMGIPSLLVGTILVAYGSTGLDVLPQTVEETEQQQTKGNCATAGYVLMPFGAALTIVGIPLHIHGKRIAELNFNYTGNGAGVSVEF